MTSVSSSFCEPVIVTQGLQGYGLNRSIEKLFFVIERENQIKITNKKEITTVRGGRNSKLRLTLRNDTSRTNYSAVPPRSRPTASSHWKISKERTLCFARFLYSILFSFLYADAPSKTIRLAQFLLDRHIFFYFFFSFQPFLPHLHRVARTLSTVIIHTTPAHTYKKRKKMSAFGSQLTSSNKFKNGTFHPVGYFSALLENGKDSSIPFRQLSKVMRYNNRRRKEQVFKDRK